MNTKNETYTPDELTAAAREHFLNNIKKLRTCAVLMRKLEDGGFEPVFVSEGFAGLKGCSAEEALIRLSGNGFFEMIHPDDRAVVREMLNSRTNDDGGSELTVRLDTASGKKLICNITFSFIDDFGEHYVHCTFFDVTVMKEHEDNLRNAYNSLGESFYSGNDNILGMFRVDLTHDRIDEIRGDDISGDISSYSGLIRLKAERYPIAEERERFLTIFDKDRLTQEYSDGNTRQSMILYSNRADGRYCYVNISVVVTRHPINGDIMAFMTVAESNNEKVCDTLLDKILVRQFDMVAYIANGDYGVIIGDRDIIGKGSIFPHTDKGNYRSYLETQVIPVLSGDEANKKAMTEALMPETIEKDLAEKGYYFVDIVCCIDGDIYYKRLDFYSVDPEAKFWIVLKSDTTSIHNERMRRNEQLRIALEEARQANVAKTAFLSRMSHEIRTPMNAIIGIDNIALQEPGISAPVKEHLTKISESARYLLSLINDILDMSRIESGRMVLKNEEFSFGGFLDQINTLVSSQCKDRGLSYECVISGDVDAYYIGDDTKLKQVLINILGNAVKFTAPGGKVSFAIRRKNEYYDHSVLEFTIKDTGIGMDKEFVPRIFEAFSQEDATTTSSYGGSGLGMAITKNIVGMMNGDIKVDSEKGKGTTFTVEVTMRNSDRKNSHDDKYILEPHDMSVLIIDDDPVACGHAKIVLEEVGISSESALSGKAAIEMIKLRHARQADYNLFLIDLKMPDKDGIEVTREIRDIIGDNGAVVILTAYSWDDVEQDAIAAGVDSFLSKPLIASGVISEFRKAMIGRSKNGAEQKKPVDLNGKRILLAEDVFINAEIMKRLLKMKGMSVEHAENGQKAVELFEHSENGYFDAVLMDVRMPVMDGLQATEAIRALDREDSGSVPIIAMTANAFDEDVQRSLQSGMNAHLTKPVEPELLYSTLESFIR